MESGGEEAVIKVVSVAKSIFRSVTSKISESDKTMWPPQAEDLVRVTLALKHAPETIGPYFVSVTKDFPLSDPCHDDAVARSVRSMLRRRPATILTERSRRRAWHVSESSMKVSKASLSWSRTPRDWMLWYDCYSRRRPHHRTQDFVHPLEHMVASSRSPCKKPMI